MAFKWYIGRLSLFTDLGKTALCLRGKGLRLFFTSNRAKVVAYNDFRFSLSRELDRSRVGKIRTFQHFFRFRLQIQWKLDCWSQKQKNQSVTRPGIKHFDWFILLRLPATPTMQFSPRGGGGTQYIPGWGGAARPLAP